jgi:hypothetical protein
MHDVTASAAPRSWRAPRGLDNTNQVCCLTLPASTLAMIAAFNLPTECRLMVKAPSPPEGGLYI